MAEREIAVVAPRGPGSRPSGGRQGAGLLSPTGRRALPGRPPPGAFGVDWQLPPTATDRP